MGGYRKQSLRFNGIEIERKREILGVFGTSNDRMIGTSVTERGITDSRSPVNQHDFFSKIGVSGHRCKPTINDH